MLKIYCNSKNIPLENIEFINNETTYEVRPVPIEEMNLSILFVNEENFVELLNSHYDYKKTLLIVDNIKSKQLVSLVNKLKPQEIIFFSDNDKLKTNVFEKIMKIVNTENAKDYTIQQVRRVIEERKRKAHVENEYFKLIEKNSNHILDAENSSEVLLVLDQIFSKIKKTPKISLVREHFDKSEFVYFRDGNEYIKSLPSRFISKNNANYLNKNQLQILVEVLDRPLSHMRVFEALSFQVVNKPFKYFFVIEVFDESHYLFCSVFEKILPFLKNLMKRIFLKKEIKMASVLWEKTFENLVVPTVILDQNFNVVKKNRFLKYASEGFSKCYQNFDRKKESPCLNCPIKKRSNEETVYFFGKKYKVFSQKVLFKSERELEGEYFINQYIDESVNESLKMRVMQNEKMSAMGNMAGALAHELNNPLSGIHSMAQFLKCDPHLSDQSKKDLAQVVLSCERCQEIIKNLVEFTNHSSHNEKSWVELIDVVHATLPFLKTVLSNHQLEFQGENRSLEVYINKPLVQQVIFNLVNNSCQSMKVRGTIRLVFSSNEEQAILRVEDSGEGVPREIQNDIFMPFFTTKEEEVGTGLGLSLSKKIIEREGGELIYDSEYVDGAAFVIKLPRKERKEVK